MNTQAESPRRWSAYVAVETGTLLSGSANGITSVALPWLVLERTGSATLAGVLAAITALPTAASALFSGTIVDRIGRRTVSVGSDILSLISVALIPIVDVVLGLNFGLLVALAILGAVFDPAGMGAREAMIPESARRAGISLARANGIHEAVWGLAFVLGPALGGLLIGVVGAAATFWATAVMFCLSALVIAVVPIPGSRESYQEEEGFWTATVTGLRFVWRDRLLRSMSVLMMVLVAAWLPVEGVLLPAFFESQNAPEQFGLAMMALSAGVIIGALAYGALGERLGQYSLFVGAMVLTGIFVLLLSTLPSLGWLLAWGLLASLAYGPVGPILNVAMQVRTPERLRGRVVGLLTAVQYAAGPIGFLAVGPLVDSIGVENAFLIVGVVLLIICLATLLMPSLRALKTLPVHLPEPDLPERTEPPRPMT
ncbi:MAG: MFS transporter [Actinobacteria bacterium]|nr:MFS transporter [Actinomycetota bacterium]